MAGNRVRALARQLYLIITDGGVAAGDPCLIGQIPGVAMQAKDTSNGAVVDMGGAYNLSVKAINDAGNSAVAVGDAIFYVTGDTPKLSKKASGMLFGWALAIVTTGATATIAVKLATDPGSAGAGNLGTNQIPGSAIATGVLNIFTIAGTTSGTNVTLAAMSAADEVVYVGSMTTSASITAWADRTSEYVAGAGVLTKAAGTNETNNLLLIVWHKKH
jgi:hypothetical protein